MVSEVETKEEVEEEVERLGLRWQCEKCGTGIEATPTNYLRACRMHPQKKGCAVRLVDGTGDVVANNNEDAIRKGIFPRAVKKAGSIPGTSSGGGVPRDGQPLFEGFFRTQRVELDPKVQLYYQIFVQEGLIPAGTTLGEFIVSALETLLEVTGRKLAIVQIAPGEGG